MDEFQEKKGLHPATLYLIWAALFTVIVTVALVLEFPALSEYFGRYLHLSDGWADIAAIDRAFTLLQYAAALIGGLGVEQVAAAITFILLLAVARHIGLLAAIANGWCRRVSVPLIPASVALVGVTGGIVGIYWQLFFIPVAALVFQKARLHPVAGIVTAYASGCASHAANLILPGGARQFLPDWFAISSPDTSLLIFNSAYAISAFLVPLTVIGFAWMCWRVTEPALIRLSGGMLPRVEVLPSANSAKSRRGASSATLLVILIIAVLVALVLLASAGFHLEDSGSIQPILNLIPAVFMGGFVAVIIVFGIRAGTLRSDQDVWSPMVAAAPELVRFVVMAFAVGALISATSLVNWSWLVQSVIEGASEAADGGLYGLAFLLYFSIFCVAFIAPTWALSGMFAVSVMKVFTQLGATTMVPQAIILMAEAAAYMVSPVSLALVYAWLVARQYLPDLKLGQFIAGLIPYAAFFAAGSLGLAVLWHVLGLPVLAGGPFR